MKTIIFLSPTDKSHEILEEIRNEDYGDFKCNFYSDNNNVQITIDGNFSMDYKVPYLWIEDSHYCYFKIPTRLITRVYIIGE